MQLVTHRARAVTDLIERVLGDGERFVGFANAQFGVGEPRLSVGECRFARLEVEPPIRHLLSENAVGL